MEFVKRAYRSLGKKAYRLSLKWLRRLVDRADEWLHARELAIANAAIVARDLADVDPAASRRREKEIAGVSAAGCSSEPVRNRLKTTGARPRLSAGRVGPRRQFPKLKYQHGEFVRQA